MSVTDNVRAIAKEAEPLVEQWLDAADQLAGLRDVAKDKGIDWSALKAILVARVRDNQDGGERVKKLAEKADLKLTYADMLSKPIVAEENKKSDTIYTVHGAVPPDDGIPPFLDRTGANA